MAKEGKDFSTVVIAALIGGLAGAIVGLLVAPKSGSELRKDIEDKAKETWHSLEEITSEKADILEGVRADVVSEGKRLVEDLKALVYELRHHEIELKPARKKENEDLAE